MSVTRTAKSVAKPSTHRWTREQYFRLSELGWFAGQRVELVRGRILDTPYARAGIAEYWIVNLVDRQLEIFRDPVTDPARRPRHRYATEFVLRPGDTFTRLTAPRVRIAVAKLLPRESAGTPGGST